MFALANVASNWLTAGQEAQRLGNAHASIVPYQTFQASDCELVVGAGNNKQVLVMERVCLSVCVCVCVCVCCSLKISAVRVSLRRPRAA